MKVALAGYISSVEASLKISQSILPENIRHNHNQYYDAVLSEWKLCSGTDNFPENKWFQSERVKPRYENRFGKLFQSSSDIENARLLSISAESSSVWLEAIPIPSLGLHLDPMSLKIACGLYLGTTLCHPHQCICGVMVDSTGPHGLSWKK